MSQSSIWREEIWHPLSVHFPIALLLFATMISAVSLFVKKETRNTWQFAGSLLLFTGSLAAWLAIYTGGIADGAVARTICDPTILKDHENASYTMAYLFSAAAFINLILIFMKLQETFATFLKYGMVLVMLTGSGYLVYTSHVGATLVYQQGAGVHKPSADCKGF
ncbi:DUF2231 domain-containing protein [Paradesertivirga mongoliensis]|uniref:DUF2231 domain-containing protein n=1 Tax=Paradesertivirga mongoliensis TaxID=2100740 RepID=A0ABW4ZQ27_9SPHI|nr:DUF2231 domain-containing protein [Pedobacter mongoliensis]